jgi:hypothetical protein
MGSTCATTRVFSYMTLIKHGFVFEKIFSCDFWLSEKLGCYNLMGRLSTKLHTPYL